MTGREPSEVVRVVCAAVGPFIALFGLYVIANGHYVPGGGFAGGVVVAVAVVLARIVFPPEVSNRVFPPAATLAVMAGGMALFLLAGFVPMLGDGAFLDYAASPVAAEDDARTRYLGILLVEVGVGMVVTGGMVLIFDMLAVHPGTDAAGDDDGSAGQRGDDQEGVST